MNWFHKWMNPHCEHCYQEQHSETSFLRTELEKAQRLNELLMSRLLEKPVVESTPAPNIENLKPISSGVPWRIKQGELEREARVAATRMTEQRKAELSVEDIEKELGVSEGGK